MGFWLIQRRGHTDTHSRFGPGGGGGRQIWLLSKAGKWVPQKWAPILIKNERNRLILESRRYINPETCTASDDLNKQRPFSRMSIDKFPDLARFRLRTGAAFEAAEFQHVDAQVRIRL